MYPVGSRPMECDDDDFEDFDDSEDFDDMTIMDKLEWLELQKELLIEEIESGKRSSPVGGPW